MGTPFLRLVGETVVGWSGYVMFLSDMISSLPNVNQNPVNLNVSICHLLARTPVHIHHQQSCGVS